MRVGMKQAVHEHLLQVGLEQFLCQRRALQVAQGQRAERGDLLPVHLLHGQDGPCAVIRHGLRHLDEFEFL